MSAAHTTQRLRPTSLDDLRRWISGHLNAPADQKAELLGGITTLFDRHRQLWQESKHEAIRTISAGFSDKVNQLHSELVARDTAVSNIARYFEEVVADLTDKAHRDPKTKLMNFEWFMERLESYLALEQRVRWCAIGIVDLRSFKWVNDNLGHATGDLIIGRVAALLADQIRSQDILAQDRHARDLHARFGGDEFSFLIPDLASPTFAEAIAARFKRTVEEFPWDQVHPRLGEQRVGVDVGVVCLQLGPLEQRPRDTRQLAEQLVQLADRLMYGAKGDRASRVYLTRAHIVDGQVQEILDEPVA